MITTTNGSGGHRAAIAFFAVVLLAAAFPTGLQAADYEVFGRVYAAAALLAGEDVPDNPLTGKPADQIVGGANHFAVASRSMVRVAVLSDPDGALIRIEILVVHDGTFYMTFSDPAPSLSVHFRVTDAMTGATLLESEAVTVRPGPNLLFLLVPGEVLSVGGAIPFPDSALGDTIVFTRVGKVELSLIEPSGLVDISDPAEIERANLLGIPKFRDAPFGGKLFLFGGFSRRFYPGIFTPSYPGLYCYKMFVNDGASVVPVTDPLYKTRYSVQSNGSVLAEPVRIGPDGNSCYRLTPISEPGDVFWSFPDLLMLWRTGARNGMHTLSVEMFETASMTRVIPNLVPNANSTLKLSLDNHPVTVSFNEIIQKAQASANDVDLLANLCRIVDLSGNRELFIRFTAHHPGGFMHRYALTAVSNDPASGSAVWTDGDYLPGTPFSGTAAAGDTLLKQRNDPPLTQPCAYILRLWARARTTNGYHYINRRHIEKAYYISP